MKFLPENEIISHHDGKIMKAIFKFICGIIIVLSAVEHAKVGNEEHLVAQYEKERSELNEMTIYNFFITIKTVFTMANWVWVD